MDSSARARLRHALQDRYPWVEDQHWGPTAVEAGECDGCGAEARLAMTCGPGAGLYLGRGCVLAHGSAAWCAGHGEDARAAVAWVSRLPGEADTVARLWWVATGEVTVDPALLETELRALSLPRP